MGEGERWEGEREMKWEREGKIEGLWKGWVKKCGEVSGEGGTL